MIRLRGIAAAPGVAIAPPRFLGPLAGDGAPGQVLDLDAAIDVAVEQLEALSRRLATSGRGEEAGIFEAQALLARDEELLRPARALVAAGERADAAIIAAGDDAAGVLESLEDEVLAGRAADVRDVAARVARAIRGEAPPRLTERAIIVARDLAPSVTAELDPSFLAGIALESGSRTSHAAILARALGIPAVLAVPGLLEATFGARELVLDGDGGAVVIEPSVAERQVALAAAEGQAVRQAGDRELLGRPLATADGHRVMLAANIGAPDAAARALEAGAEGIGLLRTEFTFLDRSTEPDEATQAAAYGSIMRLFGQRPVVVRLLDAGGDKPLPYVSQAPEANPFLGVRAIRLAWRRPDLLRTQMRAILRAALAEGIREPHLMAPMVSDLADLRLVRGLLDESIADAGAEELRPRLGIMIEIPSAVLVADQLAAEAAFLSIGTNDLTQYLLAADRTNPELAHRQDPLHPAVLRSIARVVEAARAAGIPVAACGEMAGEPLGAVLLVGLGVDELSMEPAAFGAVKRAVASVTVAEAKDVARRSLEVSDAELVRRLVTAATERPAPS